MSVKTGLNKAYKLLGGKKNLAGKLGIKYQTVNRWHDQNKMPCSDFNGKTMYSKHIQELTNGKVTIKELCGHVPYPQAEALKNEK